MSGASTVDSSAGRERLSAMGRVWLFAALVSAVMTMPGCDRAGSPSAAASRETVVLAVTPYAGATPAFVAIARGYFEREGLTVTVQHHSSGKEALDAVLAGKADIATVAELPVALAAVQGHAVTVLATLSTQSDHAIVARTDHGIGSPEALRGKRIGVSAGTSGDFVLDVLLVRSRLSRADVQVVDLKPRELADALARGEVDAIATWEPHVADARQRLGDRAAVFPSEGVYDSSFNLASQRDFALQRGEAVRRVLRALLLAEDLLKHDRAACVGIVAQVLQKPPEEIRELLSRSRFALSLDQHLLVVLEDEARWAMKNRVVDGTQSPNFLDVAHVSGLVAVKPRAVTIIR
ncbi:ABC transporter substrate-binding protein [Roseateles chitinivorans]|uniref:ABC transporter substrate-binding protein n=1 Tax=Roseateles chitinivorans TaxID=2917965 RepID=UPI003D66E710